MASAGGGAGGAAAKGFLGIGFGVGLGRAKAGREWLVRANAGRGGIECGDTGIGGKDSCGKDGFNAGVVGTDGAVLTGGMDANGGRVDGRDVGGLFG